MPFVKGNPPVNESGMISLIQYVNTSTNDMFGFFTLITWAIIAFVTMRKFASTAESLTATAFTTTVLSFLMFLLGIIPIKWVTMLIFITALCSLMLIKN